MISVLLNVLFVIIMGWLLIGAFVAGMYVIRYIKNYDDRH